MESNDDFMNEFAIGDIKRALYDAPVENSDVLGPLRVVTSPVN